ncbi:MAG: dihydroorotate dehydrogenase electron transfer subunit [Bacteroidales bacterium]|nr:dihydroorotate dehydrogenase electron transfer subunit [Bacteroidales bacterium]MDY6444771.1 dihydroorotate dehydrogenase electron transfer subunit [Bacteroidales bacterium]
MQKRIFHIESNDAVARDTFRIVLRTDGPVAVRSGQFVDLDIPGYYLRRPISVSDSLPDGVVLYYKVVGEGTRVLSTMSPGSALELLLPLGNGFHPEKCAAEALLIGGGLGAAPLYLLAKELLAAGRKATAVLGFNKADEICLVDELKALGVPVHIATMDGSVGTKGFVTDAIAAAKPAFDRFYTCGPLPMMKAVCADLSAPGEVSLEERMGCGAGFCYGCTVQTASGPRRVCADGPVFDKEEVLW